MSKEHWIWLSQVLSKASHSVKPVMDRFGSAEDFFEYCNRNSNIQAPITAKERERVHNISADDIYHISKRCDELGIDIIPYNDARYPERIKSISNPPVLLYVKGSVPDFDGECAVTVVGPREPTDYGMRAAFSLSRRLAFAGCLIISGGAMGVDGMAHRGALSAGRQTAAVLGCGINYDYPKGNCKLREQISENGCLISEYPPDFPPSKVTYPARNRILSAISCGTVVIEAPMKSGALGTAGYAAEQGRDVFVIPGNPSLKQYEGSNKLLKDGAKPVLTAADVLEEYYSVFPQRLDLSAAANAESGSIEYKEAVKELGDGKAKAGKPSAKAQKAEPASPAKKPELELELSRETRIAYESIKAEVFTSDEVVLWSGLDTNTVISALTELEIFALIISLPGGRYKIS